MKTGRAEVGPKNTNSYFFYLEKLKTKKKVLTYKYIMNSIIHCNTSYTAIQTRNNYYFIIKIINIFLDHKKLVGQ